MKAALAKLPCAVEETIAEAEALLRDRPKLAQVRHYVPLANSLFGEFIVTWCEHRGL